MIGRSDFRLQSLALAQADYLSAQTKAGVTGREEDTYISWLQLKKEYYYDSAHTGN